MLVSSHPDRALAFAEALASAASEESASLGTVTLSGEAARLLTPTELLAPDLRDDFWLIVSRADGSAMERIGVYAKQVHSSKSWRTLIVSALPARATLPYLRPDFALVEVS
jgi:hypothetical protein